MYLSKLLQNYDCSFNIVQISYLTVLVYFSITKLLWCVSQLKLSSKIKELCS